MVYQHSSVFSGVRHTTIVWNIILKSKDKRIFLNIHKVKNKACPLELYCIYPQSVCKPCGLLLLLNDSWIQEGLFHIPVQLLFVLVRNNAHIAFGYLKAEGAHQVWFFWKMLLFLWFGCHFWKQDSTIFFSIYYHCSEFKNVERSSSVCCSFLFIKTGPPSQVLL